MKAVQGKKKNKAANFVIQGSILAMAGILVRIIGMLYRMPLNDIIGKQGNGYYTSAYNVNSTASRLCGVLCIAECTPGILHDIDIKYETIIYDKL